MKNIKRLLIVMLTLVLMVNCIASPMTVKAAAENNNGFTKVISFKDSTEKYKLTVYQKTRTQGKKKYISQYKFVVKTPNKKTETTYLTKDYKNRITAPKSLKQFIEKDKILKEKKIYDLMSDIQNDSLWIAKCVLEECNGDAMNAMEKYNSETAVELQKKYIQRYGDVLIDIMKGMFKDCLTMNLKIDEVADVILEYSDTWDSSKSDAEKLYDLVSDIVNDLGNIFTVDVALARVERNQNMNGVLDYDVKELDYNIKELCTILELEAPTLQVTAGTKKATLSWNKVECTGYEIQYGITIVTVKNNVSSKTVKTTIKQLKKGKTYYFKVRAYREINNVRIYSPWSKQIKVKIK